MINPEATDLELKDGLSRCCVRPCLILCDACIGSFRKFGVPYLGSL